MSLGRKRTTYGFEKRQKEIKKQKKREEKLAKKLAESSDPASPAEDAERRPVDSGSESGASALGQL